jgi:hypothetical protein
MEYQPDKQFLVQYILKELGRDIYTTVSKTYNKFEKVTATNLFNFAREQSLVFQLEESTIKLRDCTLQRIHLYDDKKRTHLLALEMV